MLNSLVRSQTVVRGLVSTNAVNWLSSIMPLGLPRSSLSRFVLPDLNFLKQYCTVRSLAASSPKALMMLLVLRYDQVYTR